MTSAVSTAPPPVLELRHVSKTFAGTRALEDANLIIRRGEIHGLVGQNGSGKSTLIKILAGFHSPDPGADLLFDGRTVDLPLQPGQFRQLGMSFVHQDLGLILSLSVLENLRIDELSTRHRWLIRWGHEQQLARELFRQFGLSIDPAAKVADLTPANRALLAIVRALGETRGGLTQTDGYELLILDEPTVFLPATGKRQLFDTLRDIAHRRASVLFVSHDLEEVLEITDRVTVLRDGQVQGTVDSATVTKDHLVEMIVGRRFVVPTVEHHRQGQEAPYVSVRGLTGWLIRDVAFDLHRGEVVGLTGLAGTGFEEIPYLLSGARRAAAGTLTMNGATHDLATFIPARAVAAGVALVPADRLRDGSEGSLSIADNVLLPVLDRYFQRLRLDRARMARDARTLLGRFTVRPNRPTMKYQALSGGNQQKALLAKWLQTAPRLLLLHEPTQGVDIGARQEIFQLLRDSAREGTTIVCASTDYEQIAAICDRVLVFGRGRVRELGEQEMTKERIAEQCYALMGEEAR